MKPRPCHSERQSAFQDDWGEVFIYQLVHVCMERIIIKVGTKVLAKTDGTLDRDFLERLIEQVSKLRKRGIQVVVVTSGAVGAGKSLISIDESQSETVRKQVFAAVGQVKLMSTYAELFAAHGYLCAQVLATKEDFRDDEHYQNMKHCFEGLFLDNVIPIVNENDVVATTELLFTDNDELAGLVAEQLHATKLIILTGTDGVLDDGGNTIAHITSANADDVGRFVRADTSTGGRGGMISKFKVAQSLSQKGVEVWIVNGKKREVVAGISTGDLVGTRFI